MKTSVTIKDVAAAAGVSIATASRVLSGSSATSPASRDAVNQAVEALGYMPNQAARTLRSSASNVVAVLVSDVRNPYFGQLTQAIQTELAAAGYAMILGNASETVEKQEEFLNLVMRLQVDGLIMVMQSEQSAMLDKVLDVGVPVVFIDRLAAQYPVPAIVSDSYSGIKEALLHLQKLGHKNIGMLAGDQHTSTGLERAEAFSQLAPKMFEHWQLATWPHEDNNPVISTQRMLDSGVTAIIYAYTPYMWPCINELIRSGVRIPHDLSIIAYDDLEIMKYSNPPLTTIRQNISQMAARSVHKLQQLKNGEKVLSERIETNLLVRSSTSAPH